MLIHFSFVKDSDGVGACEHNPVADPGTKKGRFIGRISVVILYTSNIVI
jgi:hypothetical protein